MKPAISFLRKYVDESAILEDWNDQAKAQLPLAVSCLFSFGKIKLLGTDVVLMKPTDRQSVGTLQELVSRVEERCGIKCVLVLSGESRYSINQLIKNRFPFVIPDKQFYLPFLAMFMKNTREIDHEPRNYFSPGTQLVFLLLLYSEYTDFTQKRIADEYELSSMSVSRAMSELEAVNLVSFEVGGKTGREKTYHMIDKERFYAEGKDHLTNPIKRTVYVDRTPGDGRWVKSDLYALASMSMLSSTDYECYGIYDNEKEYLDKHMVRREVAIQENLPRIQVMKYNVNKISKNGCVDPITLMLSLSEWDERIEMSVSKMMEEYDWYKG